MYMKDVEISLRTLAQTEDNLPFSVSSLHYL